MNKILRYSFIALLALVCQVSFADKIVTFDATADKSSSKTLEKDGVTITIGNGTLGNGSEYRIFKSQKITISCATYNISKIVFTCTANGTAQYGPGSFGTLDGYSYSGKIGTWTGSAASVAFTTSNNQVRAKKIEVSIADGSVSKKEAELKFSEETINHEVGSTFTAPTFSKATTANVTFTSDNEDVATVNSEGVISLGTEEGKAVIKATSAANDLFLEGSATCTIYVYHMNAYKQATSIESGKGYLLVAKRDGKTYYAMPLSTSATHGYVKATEYEEGTNEIKVKSTYDDEFVFTVEGDGYSIKDNQGRYYIQQGTYNSFNTAMSPSAWTVEAQGDGTYKIAMNGYYMQFGQGTNISIGLYTTAQDNTVMPMLYELDNTPSNINDITIDDADANAPVYNLAGQKVSESYKGVVIKAGKKFVQK